MPTKVVEVGQAKPVAAPVNPSWITSPRAEWQRLIVATLSVMSGAASYILMTFVAMPTSIHMIVNMIEDDCDPENADNACFAPTEKSQSRYNTALMLLRLCTIILGSFLGALSDRLGRKPLMLLALVGYASAGVLYLIGWETKNYSLFVIGAMVLGTVSPITPTGVAYVSDISTPDKLATNLGFLQGVGYFVGLLVGALGSLGISAATIGKTTTADVTSLDLYSQLFKYSYGAGIAFSGTLTFIALVGLPESLHPSMQRRDLHLKSSAFWIRANPFQFFFMFTKSKYMFCLWLATFIGYISVGASEAVTAGWWMRRYAISSLERMIKFLVFFWLMSGLGSVIMTKLYVKILGTKKACHLTMLLTIVAGVVVAVAEDITVSYIGASISFFASASIPILLSLLLAQGSPTERGALVGALRSSEALGKLIGIAIFGGIFVSYIAPFTPDTSCVPSTYSPINKTNTCDCGVYTCPTVPPTGAPYYLPKPCTLGQLSTTFGGVASKSVPFISPDPHAVVPQFLIDSGLVKRDDTCLGPGGIDKGIGFVNASTNRAWCAGASTPGIGPMMNNLLGCKGFDINNMKAIGCLQREAAPLGMACYDAGAKVVISTYSQTIANKTAAAALNGTPIEDDVTLKIANMNPNTMACIRADVSDPNDPYFKACRLKYFQFVVSNFMGTFDLNKSLEILGRVKNTSFVGDGHCPDEDGPALLNLCWKGPIDQFPGIIPLIYLAGLGALSYIFFLLAELAFANGDATNNHNIAVAPK